MNVQKKVILGAFTQLIIELENDLYRVAKARLEIEDDICDAIQETMIIAYKKIKNLKETRYFKTWIIKILINECNNIYRRKSRQLAIFNKSVEQANITNKLENKEINEVHTRLDIENIINKLEAEERLLITLYYNSQFSIQEISNILDCNINTVKSKLSRTKSKIKKMYGEVCDNE